MGRAELGGRIADRYRLRAVIRRGGVGVVWLAGDELLHRQVAAREIAWVPQHGAGGQESRHERALREARAVTGLDHPNIAGIYDVVQDDGRLWMVMPPAPFRFPYRLSAKSCRAAVAADQCLALQGPKRAPRRGRGRAAVAVGGR
jgi:hypothetical protein